MAPWNKLGRSKSSLSNNSADGAPSRSNANLGGGDDLLRAMNSDLQHTIRSHKNRINDQRQFIEALNLEIKGLREEKELLQSQVWTFSEQVTQSRSEGDALRINIQTQLEASRAEVQIAGEKFQEQMQELASQSDSIRTLSGHNQKLQKRVADLEIFAEVASRDTGTDFRAFFTHYAEVKSENDELALKLNSEAEQYLVLNNCLIELEKSKEEMRLAFEERQVELQKLTEEIRLACDERVMEIQNSKEVMRLAFDKRVMEIQESKEAMRSEMDDRLLRMQSENDTLQTIIDELQKDASELEDSQPQTLRAFLTLRLVEQTWNVEPSNETSERANEVRNWLPSGLSQKSLDEICNSTEMQHLANALPKGRPYSDFYQRFKLTVCASCSRAKFSFKVDAHPRFNSVKWLNEYISKTRYFSCCFEEICKECFQKHLITTLETKWWYKLDTIQWFPCPREGCGNALGIRCEADLETCLEQICRIEAEQYVKMYTKALAFRQALGKIEPQPTTESLKKAAELHQKLFTANQMYSLFDPRFDPPLVDETGCIPEFKPGMVFSCVMDNEPSSIPLFLKFLRRRSHPKSCIVCSKNMFDIDYGDVGNWKASCKGFEGSWMWNILVFPTSESQQCDHDFEVCKACTAEHLRSSLTSGGPSACENLHCPQCGRKFGYQEIHKLADAETVVKYEKFLLQTLLSKEPGFRWCLSPLCENGQQYQRDPINPKISCEECDFQMCFTHEMPWHEGLTCEEYESQRDHGDPSFAETREWIKTNTKPCPGCQVGIQKGEACFHMTCTQCSHEFCWQCLADWQSIRSQGQEGHEEGCFFRTNVVRPTGLRGENLEDALRARNAG